MKLDFAIFTKFLTFWATTPRVTKFASSTLPFLHRDICQFLTEKITGAHNFNFAHKFSHVFYYRKKISDLWYFLDRLRYIGGSWPPTTMLLTWLTGIHYKLVRLAKQLKAIWNECVCLFNCLCTEKYAACSMVQTSTGGDASDRSTPTVLC